MVFLLFLFLYRRRLRLVQDILDLADAFLRCQRDLIQREVVLIHIPDNFSKSVPSSFLSTFLYRFLAEHPFYFNLHHECSKVLASHYGGYCGKSHAAGLFGGYFILSHPTLYGKSDRTPPLSCRTAPALPHG